MQLTTPVLQENDPINPGENWFFYWKSSPSLWEGNLRKYQGVQPLFVPIYWGVHEDTQQNYDFGENRPETDLNRLIQIIESIGIRAIFILPLGPVPFVPNGGLPSYLANTAVLDDKGVMRVAFDGEGNLNKLYSFFEPQVYHRFIKFITTFHTVLQRNHLKIELMGGDFGFLGDELEFQSYFRDSSRAFDQGLSRYYKQIQQREPDKILAMKDDKLLEMEFFEDYIKSVQLLYEEEASEILSDYWVGVTEIVLLGGDEFSPFLRSASRTETLTYYFKQLEYLNKMSLIPSTVLLNNKERGPLLKHLIHSVMGQNFLQWKLDFLRSFDDELISFKPYHSFALYLNGASMMRFQKRMRDVGLAPLWSGAFSSLEKIESDFVFSSARDYMQEISFFITGDLTEDRFTDLLKVFMNGGRVFVDISLLKPPSMKKLHRFFVENEIKVEKLQFLTKIIKAELGHGNLIGFDGEKLLQAPLADKVKFWEKLITFLDVKTISLETDEGVFYCWQSRSANSFELNYLEIRRVSFFNPTSYKKKAKILGHKNFAFLKSVDAINAEVQVTPIGHELLLQPGGSIKLDFGHFD